MPIGHIPKYVGLAQVTHTRRTSGHDLNNQACQKYIVTRIAHKTSAKIKTTELQPSRLTSLDAVSSVGTFLEPEGTKLNVFTEYLHKQVVR